MYFHTNKSINKRLLTSFFVLASFGLGLLLFFSNRNAFTNYKSYYFQSYAFILPYKIKHGLSPFQVVHVNGSTATSSGFAKSVPVLLYHGVLGGTIDESNGEATNIDLATFWDQMKTLKENGWSTINMSDFYEYKMGRKELPAKSFLLTFDDGRKDSYYPANPILKALGFHAVMFVIEQYSLEENSSYYLTKAELSEMEKSPEWEIQSHGYSSHSEYPINETDKAHFFSNKLWLPDLKRNENTNEFQVRTSQDLIRSKENLEKAFDKPIIAFAFPFGDYGQSTVNFPGAEGTVVPEALNIYKLLFYQYSSYYRYTQSYPETSATSTDVSYMVKRIGISPQWSGKDLLNVFESGYAKTLPFKARMDKTDGWINTNWGTMTIKGGEIDIAAEPDSTGSTIILDGSAAWQDYSVTAKIKWIKGSNVYLEVRSTDDNNLAACNFKRDLVHVEQIYNGESRVIAGVENKFEPGKEAFQIGMKVHGRTVECTINGNTIVSSPFLEEPLMTGGIGVKTWDTIPGNSEIVIQELKVDQL